jgi:protein TonB
MSTQAAPEFDTIRVDLAQLDLPEPESTPPKEADPEPEPPPIPDPPREITARPPESSPATQPDVPEPEPEVDLVPPDPELPREPEPPPEPEPEPEQEALDLPEPEVVKPETPEPPPPAPEETMVESEPEAVSESASVQMSAPEGVDDYYLALVKRKIGRRWEPTAASARGRRDVKAVVAFRIGPGGEILQPTVVESSGLTVFDRQALRAVMSANPLPTPPPRLRGSGLIPIRFTFIYNP